MEYTPGSLGAGERAALSVSSDTAGGLSYSLSGRGLMPHEGPPEGEVQLAAVLGRPAVKALAWTNPLQAPASVRVALECAGEAPGVFSLGPPAGAGSSSSGGSGSASAAGRQRRSSREAPAAPAAGGGGGGGGAALLATVPPGGKLQLPVSFCPRLLREAEACLTVELLEPSVPAPAPLVWRFPLRGLAQADTRGVAFA